MKLTSVHTKIIAVVVLLALVTFLASQINRAPARVSNLVPIKILTSNMLVQEFENNEILASENYINQIIQVSGRIHSISKTNEDIIIVLKDSLDSSAIICQMFNSADLNSENYIKGDKTVIKGICTGYLMDVQLIRCEFVNN